LAKRRVPGQPERDRLAGANEPGGCDDAIGRQLVEGAALVLLAPAAPGADGVEERPEVRRAQIDAVTVPRLPVMRHQPVSMPRPRSVRIIKNG
jgi:hypothetical protein